MYNFYIEINRGDYMNEKKLLSIERLIRESNFNGCVLIAQGDNIIFKEAYGMANFEHKVQNTLETKFRIASISKQITATAILKLCEEGLLNVDDTLSKFIPDFPRGNEITIHHILSNSSGISNFDLYGDFYDALHNESPILGLIEMFKYKELNFNPGEKYEYSNSGYILLQYLIETVSNQSYEQYLQDNIFSTLGIKSICHDLYQNIILNRACPYDIADNKIVNALFIDMRIAGGGGALMSTIEDVHMFNIALKNYKIINPKSVNAMYSKNAKINQYVDYGYGVFLAEGEIQGKNRRMNYHTGGGPGVRTINAHYPDDNISLIILSNINDSETYKNTKNGIESIILSA